MSHLNCNLWAKMPQPGRQIWIENVVHGGYNRGTVQSSRGDPQGEYELIVRCIDSGCVYPFPFGHVFPRSSP